jgi:hypothetical protein
MSQTLGSQTFSQSSSFRYLAPSASTQTRLHSVLQAVRAIPDSWDSIAKSELVYAGCLRPTTLAFLLEQDVHYCTTLEQDHWYRELLLDVRRCLSVD